MFSSGSTPFDIHLFLSEALLTISFPLSVYDILVSFSGKLGVMCGHRLFTNSVRRRRRRRRSCYYLHFGVK
jgi:hypothetical protein